MLKSMLVRDFKCFTLPADPNPIYRARKRPRRALILMEQGNIAGKGESISSKAINIIGNGLKQGLDKEKGEEFAENLALLYDYKITQLLG